MLTVKYAMMRELYITEWPWPVMTRRYLQCWLFADRRACITFSLSLN